MSSIMVRLAALLVLSGAVVACGSDAPSLEAWQGRAQETCEENQDTIEDAYADWAESEGDLDETAEVLEELQPEYEQFIDELKDLGVPSEDGEDVEELYDTLDQDLESIGELQVAADDEDEDDYAEALEESDDILEDYEELVEELDIEDCVFDVS